jgi:8-oxo-dGTP pyrophosphatase MutT (NUDIX family)
MIFELPAAVAEHLATWDSTPAPVRDAATVMLLRDAPAGLEVFLLHRVQAMAAFGGMTVFPGGSVDPADLDADDLPWSGPAAAHWAGPLSASPELARALVCAAVRETFEEAGVLLAGPGPDEVLADVRGAGWAGTRQELEARKTSLSDVLGKRGLFVRADLLRPWAHWITPVQERRRFDTRFFVAALPSGQQTAATAGEAERVSWERPADALAARARGEYVMVPPTAITLAELAEYATVGDVLAAAESRTPAPVTPRLLAGPDGVRFLLPGDPGYDTPGYDTAGHDAPGRGTP